MGVRAWWLRRGAAQRPDYYEVLYGPRVTCPAGLERCCYDRACRTCLAADAGSLAAQEVIARMREMERPSGR